MNALTARKLNIILCILSLGLLNACQSNNKKSEQPPNDAEKVILSESLGIKNNYKGFEELGYRKGNKTPEFTLFSLDGTRFTLSEALQDNKPLLLISGSYTCDITRRNISDINALFYKYKDKINTYFVYTIDAHPSDVPSPYSKRHKIELASVNIREHIIAKQPKTYGERKTLARKCQQQNYVLAPTLVDSPTNKFWLSFGQAPNMAYLIKKDGVIYYRQTWFKFSDLDIIIKELLRK